MLPYIGICEPCKITVMKDDRGVLAAYTIEPIDDPAVIVAPLVVSALGTDKLDELLEGRRRRGQNSLGRSSKRESILLQVMDSKSSKQSAIGTYCKISLAVHLHSRLDQLSVPPTPRSQKGRE